MSKADVWAGFRQGIEGPWGILTWRSSRRSNGWHGTSDYYRWRAEISKRLIAEHGFSFVAVEGDWPDCFRLNEWAKGRSVEPGKPTEVAAEVLGSFRRWPTWMWANAEVADFLDWLRDHNRQAGCGVGFYGLDVYSLWESLERVFSYLDEHLPDAVEAAHEACRCFDAFQGDPQRYARATRLVPTSCEDEVIEVLRQVRRSSTSGTSSDGAELDLDLRQNAEVLAGAENYYRTMVLADGASWNVRDCLLHRAAPAERALLVFPPDRSSPWLSARRDHRAIGVVYHPALERRGNWVPTVMGRRYDAFCWFDTTEALHPLDAVGPGDADELENYPWAV